MGQARILVVDDSLTIRRALEVILKPRGYVLEFAEDGHQALDRAQSFEPDLILLDYVLPDMRGPDVCAALWQTPATAQTPVVLVSAKGASIREAYQNAQNVVSYITKPFKPDVVISVVENALDREVADKAEASPTVAKVLPPAEANLEETFSALLGQLEEAASAQSRPTWRDSGDPTRLTEPLRRTSAKLHDLGQHLERDEVIPVRLGADGSLVSVATTLLETHRLLCEAMVALASTGAPVENTPPKGDVLIAVPRKSPASGSLLSFARERHDTIVIEDEFSSLPWILHLVAPRALVVVPGESATLDEALGQLDGSLKKIAFAETESPRTTTSLPEFEMVAGLEQLAAAIAPSNEQTDTTEPPQGVGLEVVNL